MFFFYNFFFLFCFLDTDEDTVKRCFATFEEKFFQTCEKELAKINIFYSGKVLICVYLWKIQQHKKSLKLPNFQNNHSGHAGLPSGNYRAGLYEKLFWFNHWCGAKPWSLKGGRMNGCTALQQPPAELYEDALKWQLTYRAQCLSLSMVTVSRACVKLPNWCFLSLCRNSYHGLACLDVSNKFLSTWPLLKLLWLSGVDQLVAICYWLCMKSCLVNEIKM